MGRFRFLFSAVLVLALLLLIPGAEPVTDAEEGTPDCVGCHEKESPGLVSQWRQSRHATNDTMTVGCEVCHGTRHSSADDYALAKMPTPKTCKTCHKERVEQFENGKHALAELSVNAIPMFSAQPWSIQVAGCSGCHTIGRRHDDGSVGKCDSCHTRHLFSREEARKPEACETCHMGEDHSQYEMWRSSKHGVIHHLMPEKGRAPVCQTCHMPDGDHAVMTAWGFLALRVGIPDDEWQNAVMTIVKAIGPWPRDDDGMAKRVEAIRTLKLARLDAESFDAERAKFEKVCAKCHSPEFGLRHLRRADQVIRETTLLMARAIDVVEGLYADGILPLTEDGPKHPDLLMFYDSPTEIEQELYRMFLFHRQKAFQGAIHANPDYMHWYGWAPMKSSMQKIEALAAELRAKAK